VIEAGFVLVDKPGGWTSHDVVGKARRLFEMKKIGHAGTLDPMATGMVVLGLGRATRLLRFVQDQPKTYLATAQFGVATDSLDADGAILSREPMDVSREDVEGVIPRFVGDVMQVPPMVSALRIGGRRLYELAREGQEVERPPRPVRIDHIEIIDFAPGPYPELTFEVTCGSGTYIRSLAHDLAAALGGRAHLTALRRTRNGGHDVEAAHTIETLETAAESGRLDGLVLSPAAALVDLPATEVDDTVAEGAAHGVKYPASVVPGPEGGGHFRLMAGSRLVAVYRTDGKLAVPEVVLG
jgi:tRNA pseudouridine55 synthase